MQLHKVVRLVDLPNFVGLKRTRIEELIALGEFPKPVKLSARRKAWIEAELIDWQQQRIALRDGIWRKPLDKP
ncbi:MAG: AlpA family phage regulatory protein [Xanthobacteraceae bacterium]